MTGSSTSATAPPPGRMFDFSLRLDAPGPRGPVVAGVLRYFAHPAWYVRDRMAPRGVGPVLPVAGRSGTLVVVRGRDAVRQVCTDNETFPRLSDGIFAVPGDRPWSSMFRGVITTNGAEHRRARTLLMPIVHRSALEHYRGVFATTFERSGLAGTPAGEPFDLMVELWRITRRNMVVGILGLEPNAANLKLADDVIELLEWQLKPAVLLAPIDRSWTPYGGWLRRIESVYHRFERLIEEKRAAPPAPDALSILCHTTDEDGDALSTPEIAGELNGLFAAGFETTAATMVWALLPVLAVPSVHAALRAGDPVLLDSVVKESQRLLPAVPVGLPRRVAADVEVAGGPTVPRGALLFFAPVLEHHDPTSFPDPAVFRPARWRAGTPPSPYEFLPFGVGARRCLGAAFADLQVRETVAALVARAEPLELITTDVDVRNRGATAIPRAPVMVRFRAAGTGVGPPVRLGGTVAKLWAGEVDTTGL